MKINVSAFIELFQLIIKLMAETCRSTWHGYRICAIDGTKIALPSEKALRNYFYSLGTVGSAPTAQGSVCYDVLNDIVIDAAIEPLSVDERTLAKGHIDNCLKLIPEGKKLFILDRGYPSFDMVKKFENDGCHYVMRVKAKFNEEIDALTEPDGYVWLKRNSERFHVRVIKFKLDSGETETLITNITDKRLGKNAFKKLYFMRWPVESKIDVVKNKLQVENFSTRTVEGIKQDFFAAMYLTNVAAAYAYDAKADVQKARENKDNKYEYQPNMNELIGVLKDHFILVVAEDDDIKRGEILNRIRDEIKRNVVPIRPDRSVKRRNPRKAKFCHNQKANC